MSTNVVRLNGESFPGPEPVEDVIDTLTRWLENAKAGRLRQAALVGVEADGTTVLAWSGGHRDLVGSLDYAKYCMLRDWDNH
ncbi:hypothetical protein GJ654_04385 [Rhodoblastus acidophilus]|jgi:hypothetical protein|uniref:Uncharacterized protein n=1 Tax=Rhodoblastus acidophilus TaxID=1074 RepID=A0A6N8DIS0_RHOAC|nr:hypothetical protein [Rhodoblastus acidophilus]MCW2273692.1 hypothetical protein [Rhodoblastus acidophilus]MCW2285094.1 hypothetical protein [Rhodoblastus acidophilus]MCW2334048.1 hypothetical protein [Rhodoblastus acidophilus]MTV30227.1 hypothetical protein [Rhodoblastus acidophilus]